MKGSIRVGIGYDAHPLAGGRKLVLGGVLIPFDKGLEGWSDADVLTHAVMDALLGAASLGDIGGYFPPGDMEFKGISSLILLEKVREELAKGGWRAGNIDATIIAGEPVLGSYIAGMRRNLSEALGIEPGCLSIKASSSNRLGFTGRGEGIEARAVALIEKVSV